MRSRTPLRYTLLTIRLPMVFSMTTVFTWIIHTTACLQPLEEFRQRPKPIEARMVRRYALVEIISIINSEAECDEL
jgi:hypothetical protein